MSTHYPPLPSPSQRDESDRVGEILDTVRRIEARMASPSHRRAAIFAEVSKERERQEVKFPGQALPVIDLDRDLQAVIASYRSSVMRATRVNDENGKPPSWDWVLIEEVAEALLGLAEMQAGTGTKADARAELIQVMAVCARILESSHFDDNVIAEGGYKPAVPMVTKVTHRVGWTTGATGWRQHACMSCRIPFLVAPGDEPPKCYQCGSEATPTSAKEAEEFWSALDEVKP